MAYNQKQDEEIKKKEDELRKMLKDPNVMNEVLKDAYIPVGRSTADMLDDVLQNADIFEDQQDES